MAARTKAPLRVSDKVAGAHQRTKQSGSPNRLVAIAVAALLLLYMGLALTSSRNKSPTYDEPAHITSGYTYWTQGDFRLNPENGNLPQRWAALPLVLSNFRFPLLAGSTWERSNVWFLSDQFFHHLGNDLEVMLLGSRAAVSVLGAVLGLTVFFWSRQIFGNAGGLLSLLLSVLCPTMLAHGQMATSDMCAALFFTLSAWSLWHTLERVTPGRALLSSLAIGGLFLSKYTAVLIIPIALLLALAHYCIYRRLNVAWGARNWTVHSLPQWLSAMAAIIAVHGLVVWIMIWAAFGFRYEAAAHGQRQEFYKYPTLAETCRRAGGLAGPIVGWFGQRELLPEAYLYGAAYTVTHSNRFSFLNGDYSITGWRQYFPFCLAVKTPLALFALLAGSALALGLRRRERDEIQTDPEGDKKKVLARCLPLVVLLLVYWFTAVFSTLNIGHRHLLPTYPAMYILAGGAADWIVRSRAAGAVVGLLAVAFIAESAAAYPHYLAYFNPLIPRGQAYRHLVDSNLDWGQDLRGLKQWLESPAANVGERTVYLRYFGSGSPEYYGIQAVQLPIEDPDAGLYPMRGGIYCISATELQAVYLTTAGRWNASYERVYQALAAWLPDHQDDRETPKSPQDEQLQSVRHRFPELQLARLLAYLRQREPDAQIGYSILIYRLSDEDVIAATQGPPVELDELSWREKERLRGTWD